MPAPATVQDSAVERPPTSPTPSSAPPKGDIVLKDSVFSHPPPTKFRELADTVQPSPWPSHSATRAHLPAHADFRVQRPRAPALPKNRHVPARLSIMPRSSSGLVIATPTTNTNPLSAMLEGGPMTAEGVPRGPTLAFELEQAEAGSTESNNEDEEEQEAQRDEKLAALGALEDGDGDEVPAAAGPVSKDVPPPYSPEKKMVSRGIGARSSTLPAPKGLALASTSLLNGINGAITPIPLSVLSARRPATPMGRLMGAGGSNLNLTALGMGIGSEPSSPFSPGFNENVNSGYHGFSREPMGPLAFLANSQRSLALEFVQLAMNEDLAALSETNAEIERLRSELAAKEKVRETQRRKIIDYQVVLDKTLVAIQEEKTQLIAMRERLFLTGIQHKDEAVRAGQTAQMALNRAKGGWCRLWIDV